MGRIPDVRRTVSAALRLLLPAAVACGGTDGRQAGPVTAFVAAGFRPAAERISARFEQRTGLKVDCSYASSGTLARQLEHGAVAGAYVSANRQWMTYLLDKDLLKAGTVRPLAGDRLVAVGGRAFRGTVPVFTRAFAPDRAGYARIGIGDPGHTCVGRYTMDLFGRLGWTDRISPLLVTGRDVMSVLRYAELGEADWSLVYRSLAGRSPGARVLATVPEELHPPVAFFVAATVRADSGAREFVRYLASADAADVLKECGFIPLQGGPLE